MRNTKERFLEKVKPMPNGCHDWQSTMHRDGYGKFWYKKRQVQAHRMAYILFVGEVPNGLWVLHKCDNRKCVNIEHLYLGDAKQNTKDKIERCEWWGRMKIPRETVNKCFELRKLGWSQQRIADNLRIKQQQVSRYLTGTQRVKF